MPAARKQRPPLTVAEVESPIINSPFRAPESHWRIEQGKPPVKAGGRRRASYFLPGARACRAWTAQSHARRNVREREKARKSSSNLSTRSGSA